MPEIKWPCNACRNVNICKYESSWRMGGENWFCPVLRKYVDQDGVSNQRESGGVKEDRSNRGYLEAMNEAQESKHDKMKEASQAIKEMPDTTMTEMKYKAVASMLFFGMHQNKIALLLSIPERTFRKMFRGK